MRLLVLALALTAPLIATAETPRRVEISNPALISSADARQNLKYLSSCALDKNTVLVGVYKGQEYEFPGAMALAPSWAERALTGSERRWVSACILARTNAFGAHVQISMRSPLNKHETLNATQKEMESHTLYEGGFFGDIFSETDAGAFVCLGPNHVVDMPAQKKRQRVCTHDALDGSMLTQCGFVSIGVCPKNSAPLINGKAWNEVIHVWLDRAEPE